MRIGRTLPPAASPIPIATIMGALPAVYTKQDQSNGVFEKEINDYFGSKYCFLLSSGKAALTLTLLALKKLYPERDEVVVTAFTCYSVPAAIKKAGLKIKLCDVAPLSLDFDKERLQAIISSDKSRNKILCVIVTHLFGCPADVFGIRNIITSGIPIIEDAAQAMGEESDNKKLGAIGDVGFFSLGRGKALSTMAGGVIVTSRVDLGEAISSMVEKIPGCSIISAVKLAIKVFVSNLLQKPSLFWLPKALPFLRLGETIYEEDFPMQQFSEFQRKLALKWHIRLSGHRQARIANILLLRGELPSSLIPLCRENRGGGMIRLPLLAQTHEARNSLVELSEQNGLGIMPGYLSPINEIPEISNEFIGQHYANAKLVCDRLFTVPVHEFVGKRDLKKICQFF